MTTFIEKGEDSLVLRVSELIRNPSQNPGMRATKMTILKSEVSLRTTNAH